MREGSRTDRVLSTVAITTTATPEYVSGIIFTVIFASWLGWLNGLTEWANSNGQAPFPDARSLAFVGVAVATLIVTPHPLATLLGIALLPDFSASGHLGPRQLVEVLPQWRPLGAFGDSGEERAQPIPQAGGADAARSGICHLVPRGWARCWASLPSRDSRSLRLHNGSHDQCCHAAHACEPNRT